MTKIVNLFTSTSGLNTVDDPVSISFDGKTGVADLSEAVNIRITQAGRPSRREGFQEIIAGNFHSLFCDGGECVVGRGGDLYSVGTDKSLKGIRPGLTGERIAFCQVLNDIFYCNGSQNGFISDGISDQWPIQQYTGRETNRTFMDAPVGNHLAYMGGRIFVAVGNVLWWSERFKFGLFDRARSFVQFKSPIRMVKPVAGGLFVSDGHATYFLRGQDPKQFVQEKVADYPAYEWSEAIDYVEGSDIGLDFGLCALWVSPEGAIAGSPSGALLNINKGKVIYPDNGQGGAGLLKGYNFIHTIF